MQISPNHGQSHQRHHYSVLLEQQNSLQTMQQTPPHHSYFILVGLRPVAVSVPDVDVSIRPLTHLKKTNHSTGYVHGLGQGINGYKSFTKYSIKYKQSIIVQYTFFLNVPPVIF